MILSIRPFHWLSLNFLTEMDSFLKFFRYIMNSLPLVVMSESVAITPNLIAYAPNSPDYSPHE